jgi:hypothetical protein
MLFGSDIRSFSKSNLEVHEHVIIDPYLRPQWAQHTQQVTEDLVGEPINPS